MLDARRSTFLAPCRAATSLTTLTPRLPFGDFDSLVYIVPASLLSLQLIDRGLYPSCGPGCTFNVWISPLSLTKRPTLSMRLGCLEPRYGQILLGRELVSPRHFLMVEPVLSKTIPRHGARVSKIIPRRGARVSRTLLAAEPVSPRYCFNAELVSPSPSKRSLCLQRFLLWRARVSQVFLTGARVSKFMPDQEPVSPSSFSKRSPCLQNHLQVEPVSSERLSSGARVSDSPFSSLYSSSPLHSAFSSTYHPQRLSKSQ